MEQKDESRAALPPPSHTRAIVGYWLIWMIWTPLIIPALLALVQSHPSPPRVVLSLIGAAIFLTLYVWMAWQNAREFASPVPLARPTGVELWAPVVAMILLSLTLTQANGGPWGSLFIYTSACVSGRLSTAQAVRVLVVLLALVVIGGGIAQHLSPTTLLNDLFFIAIPGIIVISQARTLRANRELHLAQEEMARFAAVTEERLRIARDLHDLLGHNLSLIALKSELARRLIGAAPERAAAEVADVERVARTALQEVREAVAGYRQPTLESELRNAREFLAAAGVEYSCERAAGALEALPPAAEALLAWAVREGVTNVVRHSGARSCALRVARDGDSVAVEVANDDSPIVPAQPSGEPSVAHAGNGLRGLAERASALGGTFAAGPRPEGGFRLAVSVPVAARERTDLGTSTLATSTPELAAFAGGEGCMSAGHGGEAPTVG